MKKTLLFVFFAALFLTVLFSINAAADSITVQSGDLTYTVYNPGDSETNSYCEVTSCDKTVTSVVIPEYITLNTGKYVYVRAINDNAFANCWDMTSISISTGIVSIGESAFYCCNKLTSIIIPQGVKTIGYRAFYNCNKLENIILPNSIESIGAQAFASCNSIVYYEYDNAYYLGNSENNYFALIKAKNTSITSCNINSNTKYIYKGAFSGCKSLVSITIPDGVAFIDGSAFSNCENLTDVNIPGSVTSIGGSAFYYCKNLTSISIPDGVTSIGYQSFCNCYGVTSITIPDSLTSIADQAFFNSRGLETITVSAGNPVYHSSGNCLIETSGKTLILGSKNSVIPDDGSVTSIGDYAFAECKGLTGITIPNGITSLGYDSFLGCSGLTSIVLPASVESIGDGTFYQCTNISSVEIQPNSVTTIGGGAFFGCKNLTSITIPDSVTAMGGNVFYNCSNLESVTLSDNIISIGNDSFNGCANLTNINIPSALTRIEQEAFYGCENLPDIILPSGVTSIGNDAFNGCSSFTRFSIPYGVTTIENYLFNGCSNIEEIIIPTTVTSIGKFAFGWCPALTDIVIPDSVNTIDENAFYRSGITSITIPDSVTYLAGYVFQYCSSLKTATIQDGITTLRSAVFRGCDNLTKVYLPGGLMSIGDYVFGDCNKLNDVYFYGDADDWASISVNQYGNDCLTNAVKHYKATISATPEAGNMEYDLPDKLYIGDVVTLTAPTVEGYSFLGWFKGSDRVCDTLKYRFTIEESVTVLTVKYDASGNAASVVVKCENGAEYNTTGTGTFNNGGFETVTVGETITLYADDADKVLQWQNASGKVLGRGGSLTLTVGGNTEVTLVYKVEGTDNAFVQFISAFGQILSAGLYSSDDVINIPAGPSRLGYTFTCWTIENTDTEATDANIKALFGTNRTITVKSSYTAQDTKYTVTVAYEGVTKDSDVYPDIKIGSGYSVTAPDIDGYVFSCWKNAGNTVSYKKDYYIQVAGDVTLTAVYGTDATEVLPVISISAISKIDADGVHKMTASATRSIPDGYTLIEHGILFARDVAGLDENTFVYGTPGVNKHVFASSNKDGVAKLNVKVDDDSVVVSMRGYMVLEKNGVQTVYYTDIVSGSYGA